MLREIVLDTETTGTDHAKGDRVIEIGCVELLNHIPTGRNHHVYINPEFPVAPGAFAVHGLSTPGVLQQGDREAPAQLVLGVSAELALAVAAVFFAVRYTRIAGWLERRVSPEVLTAAVVALLGLYAVIGLGWPNQFAGIARWVLSSGGAAAGYQPSAYGYGVPAGGDLTGGGVPPQGKKGVRTKDAPACRAGTRAKP